MKRTPLKSKTPLKATRKTKHTQPAISKLKREADAWFSRATRVRFANSEGMVKCFTCSNVKHWKELQCGHFMSRQFNSTRYEEFNTAPQCYGCNVMHQGRQYEFGLELDYWYGEGTAKAMHQLSQKPHQFKREELEQIIQESKDYLKDSGVDI